MELLIDRILSGWGISLDPLTHEHSFTLRDRQTDRQTETDRDR